MTSYLWCTHTPEILCWAKCSINGSVTACTDNGMSIGAAASTIRLYVGVECATISSNSRMISAYGGTDNDVSTAGDNRMVTISSGVDGVTSVGVTIADMVVVSDRVGVNS